MKKLSAILLLTIYLGTQAASVCWYLYQPLSHAWFSILQQRSNMNNFGDKKLLVLTMEKDQMDDLENEEGEIVVDGILYDIEHTFIKGNNITLHLQKDEGETKWKDHYSRWNNLLHKQSNSKPAAATKAAGIFFVFFHTKQLTKDFLLYPEETTIYYPITVENYIAPHQDLVNPPPKNS